MLKKIHILLADDNKSDFNLMLFALEELDLPVEIQYAKDGEEVLEILHHILPQPDNPTYPDLILLDLELPKVHGLDVLKIIRATPFICELPVVIFSSTFNEAAIHQCYELGANSFVQKPIDFFEFAGILEGIIRFWISTE
ncbi:MAG: response regulator [Bacteroidia bacterium]